MSTAIKMKSFTELKNEYIAKSIKNNSMDIAKKMLKAQFPEEQISELTGLSISEVKKLALG